MLLAVLFVRLYDSVKVPPRKRKNGLVTLSSRLSVSDLKIKSFLSPFPFAMALVRSYCYATMIS